MKYFSKNKIKNLFGTALIACGFAVTNVGATEACTPYTASFQLEGSSPFGPLLGGGVYNIGAMGPQFAQVSAVLKGSAVFDPTSPVLEVSFSDMVVFPPGDNGELNILTAVDRSVGNATGPGTFEATTISRITGGVGLYEGTTGRAFSTNTTTVNLLTGQVTSNINVRGIICGIGAVSP